MTRRHVLLIDDDPQIARMVELLLGSHGISVEWADSAVAGRRRVEAGFDGLLLVDVYLPDGSGPELVAAVRAAGSSCPAIMLTGRGTAGIALEAMRCGASEFLDKANLVDRLVDVVERVFDDAMPSVSFGDIVAESAVMGVVFAAIRRAVPSRIPVLVRGETGTGKELVANALHRLGPRAGGPFVAVNCAGIPADLIESELFGYEKGAFTGAAARKYGRFDLAQGGTLFLDEIGELPLAVQAKLLRVLQQGEFHRVGGVELLHADVRIVSATHRNLEDDIGRGRFREDLYYRLAVYTITVPPLRDRLEDVPRLVDTFVRRCAEREGRAAPKVDPRVLDLLSTWSFPGNIRELENLVYFAVVSAGATIGLGNLPPALLSAMALARPPAVSATTATVSSGAIEQPFLTLAELEDRHVLRAMELAAGNKAAAARMLGISRMALYRKLERLGMSTAEDA